LATMLVSRLQFTHSPIFDIMPPVLCGYHLLPHIMQAISLPYPLYVLKLAHFGHFTFILFFPLNA
jgi:hypothetical protein